MHENEVTTSLMFLLSTSYTRVCFRYTILEANDILLINRRRKSLRRKKFLFSFYLSFLFLKSAIAMNVVKVLMTLVPYFHAFMRLCDFPLDISMRYQSLLRYSNIGIIKSAVRYIAFLAVTQFYS